MTHGESELTERANPPRPGPPPPTLGAGELRRLAPEPARRDEGLERALGVRAFAAITVNTIVGSGIFVLPAVVAGVLGPASLLAYLVCAIAIGLVSLCFAEDGSRVASTGGTYAYIETAFGPFAGALAGILFWFASEMLSLAAVAVVLVGSLAGFVPAIAGPVPRAIVLLALFAVLSVTNIRGVRTGARLVEVATVAKLLPLLVVVVAGLAAARAENFAGMTMPPLADLGRGSLLLIFAFTGTEGALTPSGEVKDPARTVPRAVLLALGIVTLLYMGVQLAAQGVLGPALATETTAPLAAAAGRVLGPAGRALLLAGAAISTFGYLSGNMLTAPRVLFALGRDGILPRRLASVHPRFRTPYVAIIVHAASGCAFALTGSFRTLAVLSAVPSLLIYLGCCLAVLPLRRRGIEAGGAPFVLRGGPLVPILASIVVVWLIAHATVAELAVVGAILVVAAVFYLVARRRRVLVATACLAVLCVARADAADSHRQQEIRREMKGIAAGLADFEQYGTSDARTAGSLERQLRLLGEWTCNVLDAAPDIDAPALASRIRALDPRFDDDAGDGRLPGISVARLGSGKAAAWAVAYALPWSGSLLVVARHEGKWRVAWTVRDAARNAPQATGSPWHELAPSWLAVEPGYHDGPLAGRVEALEPGVGGRPRFLVDAITLPSTGNARPGQVSVWEWDGTTAVPLFAASYPTSWDGWRVVRDGDRLRITTAEQAHTFFTCGSCGMSTEPAGEWTLRITPRAVVDEGRRWETPELELLDEILSRLAEGESTVDLATAVVTDALRDTLAGDHYALTMLEAFSATPNADGSSHLHLVSDNVDALEMTVAHRANGLYATAIEIEPFRAAE